MKMRLSKNNTSGYRGVSRRGRRWLSRIIYNRQHFSLGCFNTKEEAALAYNEKAKELFGEFAVLNKI